MIVFVRVRSFPMHDPIKRVKNLRGGNRTFSRWQKYYLTIIRTIVVNYCNIGNIGRDGVICNSSQPDVEGFNILNNVVIVYANEDRTNCTVTIPNVKLKLSTGNVVIVPRWLCSLVYRWISNNNASDEIGVNTNFNYNRLITSISLPHDDEYPQQF